MPTGDVSRRAFLIGGAWGLLGLWWGKQMTTNYHDPILDTDLVSDTVINARLGDLDSAIYQTANTPTFSNVAIGAESYNANVRLLIDCITASVAGIDVRGGGQSGRGWPSDPAGAQKLVYLTHKFTNPPAGLLGMVGCYMAYTGNLSNATATMEAFEVVNVIQAATHSPTQALLGAEIVAGLNPAGTNMSALTFPNIWGIYGNVDAPSANSGTITWARSGVLAFPSMSIAGGNAMTNACNLYLTSGQSVTPSVAPTNAYGLYVENPPDGTNRWAIYATGRVEISQSSYARLKLIPSSGFFSMQARTSNDGGFESMSFLADDFTIEAGSASTTPILNVNSTGAVVKNGANAQLHLTPASGYATIKGRTSDDGAFEAVTLMAENFTLETGASSTTARLAVYDSFSRVTNRLQWNVANSAAADSVLQAAEVFAWVNESTNALTFKVKYSNGSTVKSGTVALS